MLTYNFIKSFYEREDVIKEILDYCKNRWVALEAKKGDQRIFIRYWKDDRPLVFNNQADLKRAFLEFKTLKPRTIYASINVYEKLEEKEDVKNLDNIKLTTPIWDIDGTLDDVDIILNVAKIILDELYKYGIEKSVYLKWSGRGLHIHLHEKAISEELRKKYHPLDLAYAIVEYVLRKKKEEIYKEIQKAKGKERPFKVENKIDIQRVFTAPLSFHRNLDFVCVCFKPDEIDKFSLDWVKPEKFRHNPKWREYEEGEADELAKMAIKEVGGYIRKYIEREVAKSKRVTLSTIVPTKKRKIGRFQVMALLQAARYYLIKEKNIDKAKSFGLNRAIFYAWAKYYRPKYGISKTRFLREVLGLKEKEIKFEKVGEEQAPISDRGWFIMGDKEQLPEDFDRQVKEKIESVIPFDLAWEAALWYLSKFPRRILESQQDFYEKVYKPVRDNFEIIVKRYLEEKKKKEN